MKQDAREYLSLGDAHYEKREYSSAAEHYQKAIEIDETCFPAYKKLGIISHETGDCDNALFYLERATEVKCGDGEVYAVMGDVYLSMENCERAVENYCKAIERGWETPEMYYNLGSIAGEAGDVRKSDEYFSRCIDLCDTAPRKIDRLNRIGNFYYNIAEYERAEPYYRRIIDIDGTRDFAFCNLGNLENAMGKRKEAFEHLSRAIELNPSNINALNNLGNWHYQAGDYGEAEKLYRRSLEVDGRYVLAYYNLGNAQAAMGEKAKSRESYRKALEFDPGYAPARSALRRSPHVYAARVAMPALLGAMFGASLWASVEIAFHLYQLGVALGVVLAAVRMISASNMRERVLDAVIGFLTGWWAAAAGWALFSGLYLESPVIGPWIPAALSGALAGIVAGIVDLRRPGIFNSVLRRIRLAVLPRTVNRMIDMMQ